jgi:arginyl-tRNA synthetase
MPDPSTVLAERASAALAALGPEGVDADPVVRPSQHADFQVNGALPLAKRLGRAPREVADELATALAVDDLCSHVEVSGPGFINLTLREEVLADWLTDLDEPDRGIRQAEVTETVVVDYSAPNVAKEMHVGHLRSTVIGDSLARTMEALGHRVVRQNHLGDWGTPFGMLIELLDEVGEDEGAALLAGGDLNDFYRQARQRFEGDEGFAERARARVVALQAGDDESRRLWERLVAESQRYFSSIYDRVGVTLTADDYAGESTYNDQLDDVVTELETKDLVVIDDGALCAFPPGFTGRDDDPLPLIVRKRDGGYGYAATDLAALRHRTEDLGATWLLYVVGAPQHEHLEMVFAVGRMAGWLSPPARANHVSFGSILGADGKMFKTRSGDSVRLAELLDEAVARAAALVDEKSTHLGADERAAVADAVGIGAVKYADLSSDRIKDYTFDWDRMLALTGNTGPYLQYAHARMHSILAKADEADRASLDSVEVVLGEPAERALAMALLGFDAAVQATAERLAPHRLCTYLYDLASTYTAFYEACPVLRSEDVVVRRSRLLLCRRTADVLARGLDLLGIAAPSRI